MLVEPDNINKGSLPEENHPTPVGTDERWSETWQFSTGNKSQNTRAWKIHKTSVAVLGKCHLKEKEALWKVKSLFLGDSSQW